MESRLCGKLYYFELRREGQYEKTGDIFLGSVICFSVIIGMIGFVKNKSSIGNGQVTTEEVSSSVAAETATDMAASASDKDEEQQFLSRQ